MYVCMSHYIHKAVILDIMTNRVNDVTEEKPLSAFSAYSENQMSSFVPCIILGSVCRLIRCLHLA